MNPFLIVFGTRPEYIKVEPIITELRKRGIPYATLFTGQHPDLLQEYSVQADFQMVIRGTNPDRLNHVVSTVLKDFPKNEFAAVIVQGDTSSAFAAGLAAFHRKIPVVHIEAGLRTDNIEDPFPEEANRQLLSRISSLHFCPTKRSQRNLLNERIYKSDTFVVGNTALDSLPKFETDDRRKKNQTVLFTMHRRENLEKLDEWFGALEKGMSYLPCWNLIYPVHYNPEIRKKAERLSNKFKLIEPVNRNEMAKLIHESMFVVTDSGGIQEEANFYNRDTIVCRKDTERPEALGITSVLCQEPSKLPSLMRDIGCGTFKGLSREDSHVFGDGKASERIVDTLIKHFNA